MCKQAGCLLLAVKRLLTVVPLTHGGESKNHKTPVSNMTSVWKIHHKNFWEKILGCQAWVQQCILKRFYPSKHNYLFCLFFILQGIIIIWFSSLHSLCSPTLGNTFIPHFCCLCCNDCTPSRKKIMPTWACFTCYWQLQNIAYQANKFIIIYGRL